MRDQWRTVRLGDVCAVNPETLASSTASDAPISYIDIASVQTGRVVETKPFQFGSAPSRARRVVRPGDTLVSTVRPQLRAFARVPALPGRLVASTGFAVVRPHPGVDSEFLYQCVLRDEFVEFLTARTTGSNYPAVRAEDVAAAPLWLPPLDEQRRIAAVLSAIDERNAATNRCISALGELRDALVGKALAKPRLPWRRVADLGDVQLGRMKSPVYTTGRNRPYLRVANVLEDAISAADVLEMPFDEDDFEKFRLRPGDVLLNEGQSLDLVGRSAVYRGDPPDCAFQKTLLRFRVGPVLEPEYANAAFLWMLHTGRFAAVAVQTTSIAHLTAVRFKEMTMPVPDRIEQERVVEVVSTFRARLAAEQAEVRALQEVKRHAAATLLRGSG